VLGRAGYVGQELFAAVARPSGRHRRVCNRESRPARWVDGHELIKAAMPRGNRRESSCRAAARVSARYVHEAARRWQAATVDLSADFRLSPDAVYGLTESRGASGRCRARPTRMLSHGRAPGVDVHSAARADRSVARVIIDAASGGHRCGTPIPNASSSSAKSPRTIAPYAIGNTHRHLAEAESSRCPRRRVHGDLVFTPHLLP